MLIVKGINKKNKHSTPILKLQFSFERPVPHVVDAPKPVFNYLEDDTLRYSSTATADDDMSVNSFSKSYWWLPDASLFIWPDWKNDLIPDLYLPKQSSELLASRWQEKHLLHPGTNITFDQNRARNFSAFHFKWWSGVFPWSKIPLGDNGIDTIQRWRMETLHSWFEIKS